MAKTQKYYRLGGRNSRYITKLNPLSSGMYLTDQVIPEGYAKYLINYDIDDTGSYIRPRYGRLKIQDINYNSAKLGPVSLTDYLYVYNNAKDTVEDTKDIVLSYGYYTELIKEFAIKDALYKNPVYLGLVNKTKDTNVYNIDEEGTRTVLIPGEITEQRDEEMWLLHYDTNADEFKVITNENVGFVTSRTLKNCYAFGKAFKEDVGRPVGAILNNELIAFAGNPIYYTEYTNHPDLNTISNVNTPALCKLKIYNTGTNYALSKEVLTPRQLNPLEAYMSGYNILADNPFRFENESGGALSILGITTYTDNEYTKPVLKYNVGTPFNFEVYYQYPLNSKIKYKIEHADASLNTLTWNTVKDFGDEITAGEPIRYANYIPQYTFTLIRVTLRNGDDSASDYAMTIPVNCNTQDNIMLDLDSLKYDFTTAKGMVSWQSCVGIYGLDNARNAIFFSDVEDPSYFPFPQNIMTFDNDILAVHNYLDYLLVVTVDSIWLVTPGTTISTSIQKKILANIYIPEIDAINLVVLKDQIFFKTDDQFYVLKPNNYSSDATDLKNYTNSTALVNYMANFESETVHLLNEVYKELWQAKTKELHKPIKFNGFDVLDTHSVVRNEEVHYVYTIVPTLSDGETLGKLNLHLVYNTMTRSWRMYFVAIGDDKVFYNNVLYKNKQSGAFYEFFPHIEGSNSVITIAKQTYDLVTDNITHADWELTKTYNNYNYIDTGNIAIDDTFTKRFREVQLNLSNMGKTSIDYYVDFKLDGKSIIDATNYMIEHVTDVNSPDYGTIFITPMEQDNLMLPGMTTLAEDITEQDHWSLDISKFPKLDVATIRFNLQGRGRRGSLQLLNTSLKRYELSTINWVYRVMSAR